MKSLLSKSLLASLALFTVSATHADAAVIVTLPTATTAGSIQFTNDITFTLTRAFASTWIQVVLDEWVVNDGSFSSFISSNGGITPNNVAFEKNGTPMSMRALSGSSSYWLVDNANRTLNSQTPNDGLLELPLAPITLAIGDTFTLKAATYTMAAGTTPAGFNPQANQTFTGNMFLTNDGGTRLSADVSAGAVPEPSRALLLLGGLSTLAFRRRRVA